MAAAILIASPALVGAQDIFWSFSPTELVTELNFGYPDPCDDPEGPISPNGGLGSAYIFSDGLFGFDYVDVEFTTSDSGVMRFTGGETFNSTFASIGGEKFEVSDISIDSLANSGRLFSISVLQNGVDPMLGPLYDPEFNAGVGPNGAVLLARVDFEVFGTGGAELVFSLGPQSVGQIQTGALNPSFGSVTVELHPPHVGTCPGDLNFDGLVTFGDIAPFIGLLKSGSFQDEADMNSDGAVDFADIPLFIARLAQ